MKESKYTYAAYIAGPYTNGDKLTNVGEAIVAADKLAVAGILPYVPHLCHFWDVIMPHEYDFWMDIVTSWLERCDFLLRLPGDSTGADYEVSLAIELRIPVFYSVEELLGDFLPDHG